MKPMCQHCGREPVTRPRGLGHRCYYTPGIRERYGWTDDRTAGSRGIGLLDAYAAADPDTRRTWADETRRLTAKGEVTQ